MKTHVACPTPGCGNRFKTGKKLVFQCGSCGKSFPVEENKD